MNALAGATGAMFATPQGLPPSMRLGDVAHHLNNYVSGGLEIYEFIGSQADSFSVLMETDKGREDLIRPVRYAQWAIAEPKGNICLTGTGVWSKADRETEQTETAAKYFEALNIGFQQFTEHIKVLNQSEIERALIDNRIRMDEFVAYVANKLVSADTMSSLVNTLIEKNAVRGLMSSAQLFITAEYIAEYIEAGRDMTAHFIAAASIVIGLWYGIAIAGMLNAVWPAVIIPPSTFLAMDALMACYSRFMKSSCDKKLRELQSQVSNVD